MSSKPHSVVRKPRFSPQQPARTKPSKRPKQSYTISSTLPVNVASATFFPSPVARRVGAATVLRALRHSRHLSLDHLDAARRDTPYEDVELLAGDDGGRQVDREQTRDVLRRARWNGHVRDAPADGAVDRV